MKPVKIPYFAANGIKIKSVRCSSNGNMVLSTTGKVYQWKCGEEESIAKPISNQVFESIDCGYKHFGAMTADGRLFMWGRNTCNECCNEKGRTCLIRKPRCANKHVLGQSHKKRIV